MTKDEAKQIINVLFVAYPTSYNGWKESRFGVFADLLAETFKNVPAAIVSRAIKTEIAQNRTNFAPSIGEVMYTVKELISVYDADSAWDEICYIVRMVDIEDVSKTLQGLDDVTRQIYTTRDIQRMKNTSGSLDREKSHFVAMYNKLKDKKETEAVESGNFLSISNEERLLSLGVSKNVLRIDHED